MTKQKENKVYKEPRRVKSSKIAEILDNIPQEEKDRIEKEMMDQIKPEGHIIQITPLSLDNFCKIRSIHKSTKDLLEEKYTNKEYAQEIWESVLQKENINL